ncbi:hypothetical protein ACHIPZ_25020 [Antrihabitans sp. NCIMB 15449]|uniref:DNA recombination protein RmuC n=1 Tax=Antrihabitans spumae TaxID=3373370 RepID=A0ABW7JTU8_9NOCA
MNVSQIAVQLGVPGIIVALLGIFGARRLNQANYAKVITEISVGIAKDLDAKVDKLGEQLEAQKQQLNSQGEQLDTQRRQISMLDGHVVELSRQLRIAIPLLEARGHDVADMRAALERAREA